VAQPLTVQPDDARPVEPTLDGFDTIDKAPEPDDEPHAARKPKKRTARKPTKRPKKETPRE
jgi:outer membrane biosynthesis protein TonB